MLLMAFVGTIRADTAVRVEFLKEHLTFTGDDNPMAQLLLSVMGAFAEFERALIGERQRRASPWPRPAAPTAVANAS